MSKQIQHKMTAASGHYLVLCSEAAISDKELRKKFAAAYPGVSLAGWNVVSKWV